MKTLSAFIALFLSCISLYAQYDSIPVGVVHYRLDTDLPGEQDKAGLTSLYFNTTCSMYIYRGVIRQDSSYNDPNYLMPVSVLTDQEGFPLFKIHFRKKILLKIPCRQARSGKYCVVSDTFGTIPWQIFPDEHRRFGQFICQKASGQFRGRTYEVWFAPDLPISSGPFKLGGLPGLILEAKSTDGHISFVFSGLELSRNITTIIHPPGGLDLNSSHGAYIDRENAFHDIEVKKIKAATGMEATITRMETIELHYKDF
jgi:GLPGLI family protein